MQGEGREPRLVSIQSHSADAQTDLNRPPLLGSPLEDESRLSPQSGTIKNNSKDQKGILIVSQYTVETLVKLMSKERQ